MITKYNTLSITELRQGASGAIKSLSETGGPLYIFQRAKPKAVMITLNHFNSLLTAYEDYLDLQELLSVKKEEIRKAIPWKKIKKKKTATKAQ